MDAQMRASDGDRERVVQALQRHTAVGRLDLDEFAARVDAANRAVTRGDLAAVTADLPAEPDRRRVPRGPVLATLVVALLLAVLLGAAAAAQTAGLLHMGTMMATMGTGMGGRCH